MKPIPLRLLSMKAVRKNIAALTMKKEKHRRNFADQHPRPA
jgi:ribosomal protein L29